MNSDQWMVVSGQWEVGRGQRAVFTAETQSSQRRTFSFTAERAVKENQTVFLGRHFFSVERTERKKPAT